jgi:hypothetical protein
VDTQLPVWPAILQTEFWRRGALVGEKVIANQAALIDAPMGSGHAILFGMRPQYRAQSSSDFQKCLFNALLN